MLVHKQANKMSEKKIHSTIPPFHYSTIPRAELVDIVAGLARFPVSSAVVVVVVVVVVVFSKFYCNATRLPNQ